jgi:hypothetical protein
VIYRGITNARHKFICNLLRLYKLIITKLPKEAKAKAKCSHIPTLFMDIKPEDIAPNNKKRV